MVVKELLILLMHHCINRILCQKYCDTTLSIYFSYLYYFAYKCYINLTIMIFYTFLLIKYCFKHQAAYIPYFNVNKCHVIKCNEYSEGTSSEVSLLQLNKSVSVKQSISHQFTRNDLFINICQVFELAEIWKIVVFSLLRETGVQYTFYFWKLQCS